MARLGTAVSVTETRMGKGQGGDVWPVTGEVQPMKGPGALKGVENDSVGLISSASDPVQQRRRRRRRKTRRRIRREEEGGGGEEKEEEKKKET